MPLWKKRNLSNLINFAVVVFLCAASSFCCAQEQEQSMGELRLEGEHIEHLLFHQESGYNKKFENPSKTLQLPVGEYRVQQVVLKGLYTAGTRSRITGIDTIKITEDTPAVLKVGAPLSQKIDVERNGAILELDYKLTGIGGESYTHPDGRKKPGFTVYKGDKVVTSGEFEYG